MNKNGDDQGDLDLQNKGDQLVSESIHSLPIISQVLDDLSKKLPRNLYYHSKLHTDDVLKEAVIFALVDGLSVEKMRLLAIAAAFHDAGFMESPVDNERIGARMAREAMKKAGTFQQQEIDLVSQMILDTRLLSTGGALRQVPTTDLSRYLLDADLSNFGREDFFDKAELQRRELGYDRELFLRKTFDLINNYRWLTNAALKLRQEQKAENIAKLRAIIQSGDNELAVNAVELGVEKLMFLSKLPLLLNSSLKTQKIIDLVIEHLRSRIEAEAVTVFLLSEEANELTFWAMRGGEDKRLDGIKMPADKGIVGWVIQNQEAALVNDVQNDARFFAEIDKEGKSFITRNLICVPLIVRGNQIIGAIQVLNKVAEQTFSEDDLLFVEQFANYVALAVDNARLHESLSQRNKSLEILDRRKKDIIQIISHEFRTPLNVIQTSGELIASGYLQDQKAVGEISGALARGVERLTKLIEQVKSITEINEDKMDFEFEDVIVSDLFKAVENKFSSIAAKRKIQLSIIMPKEDLAVRGSYPLLLLVIDNLISNSIRFTQDGGEVSLTAEKKAGLVKISVRDNGIGIEESQIPLIFEKFYEVAPAMQHSSGEYEFRSAGLGLGLSSVRSVLKAHSSAIEVRSEPDKGSVFSFNLQPVE